MQGVFALHFDCCLENNVGYIFIFLSVISNAAKGAASKFVSEDISTAKQNTFFNFVRNLFEKQDAKRKALVISQSVESGDIIGHYPSDKLDEFERSVAASGGRVEHRAKSTLLVFPDGTAEQFYDGSWLLETDTIASTTGGYFPQNAFTAQLMSVYPSTYGFTNEETVLYKQEKLFFATFSDATVEKAKQFTSALIIRGAFNLNVYEEEGVSEGADVYYFYAESFDYAIEFECVEGQAATMAIVLIESAE
jgi:hypothetical protein